MTKISVIYYVLFGLIAVGKVCAADTKIVGGTQVTNRSEFAFQASIRYKSLNYHFCGGSIIHSRFILTAAHCVVSTTAEEIVVVIGDLDKSTTTSNTTIISISAIRYHSEYDSSTYENDVAILMTSSAIQWSSTIANISLAESTPADGTNCTVSGWGSLYYGGSTTDRLMYAVVPIVSKTVCSLSYGSLVSSDGMVCAGYLEGGVDSCSGDSGGPLACGQEVAGIVSWGNACALPFYPGVYTNVAYYKNWIESQISELYGDAARHYHPSFLLALTSFVILMYV